MNKYTFEESGPVRQAVQLKLGYWERILYRATELLEAVFRRLRVTI